MEKLFHIGKNLILGAGGLNNTCLGDGCQTGHLTRKSTIFDPEDV
jgi:hypothetical protein